MGALYLENNLIPRAFTRDRLAVLELLASQAAISLDHARLYAELAQENRDRRKAEEALRASEERWRKVVRELVGGNRPDRCRRSLPCGKPGFSENARLYGQRTSKTHCFGHHP